MVTNPDYRVGGLCYVGCAHTRSGAPPPALCPTVQGQTARHGFSQQATPTRDCFLVAANDLPEVLAHRPCVYSGDEFACLGQVIGRNPDNAVIISVIFVHPRGRRLCHFGV